MPPKVVPNPILYCIGRFQLPRVGANCVFELASPRKVRGTFLATYAAYTTLVYVYRQLLSLLLNVKDGKAEGYNSAVIHLV